LFERGAHFLFGTPTNTSLFCHVIGATRAQAEQFGVTVHQLPPDLDLKMTGWELPDSIRNAPEPFDLGVVLSFGHFIPPRVISAFRHGMLNIHPSLLPK
jgi:methionyl-tRNA formyltransferase